VPTINCDGIAIDKLNVDWADLYKKNDQYDWKDKKHHYILL
jgi:hypothetical protein